MATTATVVLSGGASNGALTAGALYGIYESKKTFNTFYSSGAGAVFGLLLLAAKNMTPDAALEATQKAGIHDAIYKFFPLAYKTFYKSGPFTSTIKKLAESFKLEEPKSGESDFRTFYNDWIDLWATALTPTLVTVRSEALCAPFPFIEEFIDFEKLKRFKGRFYMNAYCIETGLMEQFTKNDITVEHFKAALAFPFIYPPGRIGSKHYYEGSAVDPLNLPSLWARVEDGEIPNDKHTVVLIDVLGSLQEALIRLPRHLLDAYGISILTPIVSLAQAKLELFKKEGRSLDLIPLTFDINPKCYPTLTDWNRSNLKTLFDIGRQAGKKFCETHRDKLPDRVPDGPDPVDPVPTEAGGDVRRPARARRRT